MHMICLPGLLCTPHVFDGVNGMIESCQMAALQLPDGDDFGKIAAGLIDALPERAIVLGMSMGSYLAIEMALRAPDRIAGLILVGSSPAADSPKAAAMRPQVVAWARREGIPALAALISDTMLGPDHRADDALRTQVLNMGETVGLDVFAHHQSALADRPDNTARLPHITCPTLVLTGSADTVTPPSEGRAIADAVPHGRFVQIEGAGHLALLEQPERIAEHINLFLKNDLALEAAAT